MKQPSNGSGDRMHFPCHQKVPSHYIRMPGIKIKTNLADIDKEEKGNEKCYWIWDAVHPTPAGHLRMAELWISKATEVG